MSWRVWWNLYKEDYQHYGIILFLLKFSYMTVLLGCHHYFTMAAQLELG